MLLTCTRLPAEQSSHKAAACCCHPLDAAAAATGWLDVALQQVQQRDRVGQPVGQAGVVVLLPLYLTADDLQGHGNHSTNTQGASAPACALRVRPSNQPTANKSWAPDVKLFHAYPGEQMPLML